MTPKQCAEILLIIFARASLYKKNALSFRAAYKQALNNKFHNNRAIHYYFVDRRKCSV